MGVTADRLVAAFGPPYPDEASPREGGGVVAIDLNETAEDPVQVIRPLLGGESIGWRMRRTEAGETLLEVFW